MGGDGCIVGKEEITQTLHLDFALSLERLKRFPSDLVW